MALKKERLILSKHFLVVDSDTSFTLVDQDKNEVFRPAGCWQLDCYKLLPKEYQKEHPVYWLDLVIEDTATYTVRYTDIDFGTGLAGVNGQLVSDTDTHNFLYDIKSIVKNEFDKISEKLNFCNGYEFNMLCNISYDFQILWCYFPHLFICHNDGEHQPNSYIVKDLFVGIKYEDGVFKFIDSDRTNYILVKSFLAGSTGNSIDSGFVATPSLNIVNYLNGYDMQVCGVGYISSIIG